MAPKDLYPSSPPRSSSTDLQYTRQLFHGRKERNSSLARIPRVVEGRGSSRIAPQLRALPRQELVSEKSVNPSEHLCFQPSHALLSCPAGFVQLESNSSWWLASFGRERTKGACWQNPPGMPSVPHVLCLPPLALCLSKSLLCSKAQWESILIYAASTVPAFRITFPLFPMCPCRTLSGCCCSPCHNSHL